MLKFDEVSEDAQYLFRSMRSWKICSSALPQPIHPLFVLVILVIVVIVVHILVILVTVIVSSTRLALFLTLFLFLLSLLFQLSGHSESFQG